MKTAKEIIGRPFKAIKAGARYIVGRYFAISANYDSDYKGVSVSP